MKEKKQKKPYSDNYWSEREKMSISEIREIQNRSLVYQVQNAIPYYAKLWKSKGININNIKSVNDITKLPITTKEELKRSQTKQPPYGLWNYENRDNLVRTLTTSGSTSIPIRVPHTSKSYQQLMSSAARALWSFGIRKEDVVHGIHAFNTIAGVYILHDICERWIGSLVIPGGGTTPTERLSMIKYYDVTTLIGSATTLIKLGNIANKKCIKLNVDKIICTGEPGPSSTPEYYDILRDLWKARIIGDIGGFTEVGSFFFTCEYKNVHINEDLIYPEIIDGKIYLTTLYTVTNQIFRYETGDGVESFKKSDCLCGRTLSIMKGFDGHQKKTYTVKYSKF